MQIFEHFSFTLTVKICIFYILTFFMYLTYMYSKHHSPQHKFQRKFQIFLHIHLWCNKYRSENQTMNNKSFFIHLLIISIKCLNLVISNFSNIYKILKGLSAKKRKFDFFHWGSWSKYPWP